jgi:hypothetical protein
LISALFRTISIWCAAIVFATQVLPTGSPRLRCHSALNAVATALTLARGIRALSRMTSSRAHADFGREEQREVDSSAAGAIDRLRHRVVCWVACCASDRSQARDGSQRG